MKQVTEFKIDDKSAGLFKDGVKYCITQGTGRYHLKTLEQLEDSRSYQSFTTISQINSSTEDYLKYEFNTFREVLKWMLKE